MKICSAGRSNIGRLRDRNEDNMFLDGMYCERFAGGDERMEMDRQSPVHVYAVSDGMGGGSAGHEAALLAVETLQAHYQAGLAERPESLLSGYAQGEEESLLSGYAQGEEESLQSGYARRMVAYVQDANSRICAEMEANKRRSMGATVALLLLMEQQAMVCNVGDSRVYLFRDGVLQCLTVDHRSSGGAGNNVVLTQHLGVPSSEFLLQPHLAGGISLEPGMMFLLCSDGVSDMVTDEELQRLLGGLETQRQMEPSLVAEEVIRAALEAGGRDNATAVVVAVER